MVFYVPARNVVQALEELGRVRPEARVVIARELTKVFEEFIAGTPAGCLSSIGERSLKGEVTLLINVAPVPCRKPAG